MQSRQSTGEQPGSTATDSVWKTRNGNWSYYLTIAEKQKKDLVREGIEAINDRDAETLRVPVAEDVVLHGQGRQDVSGAETVVPAVVDNTAFPDSQLEIEEMIAEGTRWPSG